MSHKTGIIFNEALRHCDAFVSATGGRIYFTSNEVSPLDRDNTPLPYVVLTLDSVVNHQGTKDSWEGDTDMATLTLEVNAKNSEQVAELTDMARDAVVDYFDAVVSEEVETEYADLVPLDIISLSSNGIHWDFRKPCYYTELTWACDVKRDFKKED